MHITLPGSPDRHEYGEVRFEVGVEASRYLEPGWALAGAPDRKFNTFTTSQPSAKPRWRPAGIDSCTPHNLELWAADNHRFPPYQYKRENGVHHLKKGWRLPSVDEREVILGFPLEYTSLCMAKHGRKAKRGDWENKRLTMLGNTWSVPVVALLLKSLLEDHGLIPHASLRGG